MRLVRRIAAALAGACLVWAMTLAIGANVSFRFAGARISSSDPVRPAIAGLVLAIVYALTARARGSRQDAASIAQAATPFRLALGLTIASTALAFAFNARTAGGSDSFGYVMHADMWLAGVSRLPIPLAASAPWPEPLSSFTPFAFHPSIADNSIVPVTSPGLPLLMAGFKYLAGHCAMFWVIPLSGGLLVWTTFAIGRRIASDAAGLAAGWLVATSPTFVSMNKSTMSDVPASAFWALAAASMLRPTVFAAAGAGLAASVAIVIRPNLVPIAMWMGAWAIWREIRSDVPRWRRVLAFAAGAAPGCLLIATLNHRLRGSVLASGYGELNSLFSWNYIPVNIARYMTWLAQTQTVLWIAGLVTLALPLRLLWRSNESRDAARLLFGAAIVVWCAYLPYLPFEAWWFLRFMLPSWPAFAIGTSVFVLALGATGGEWGRRAAALVIVVLGLIAAYKTVDLGVFPEGEGERRYATVAELVDRATEPDAVVIASHNSGSVRYYAGRLTLRFDVLNPEWLDRAVLWLEANGRHPYFLLEDWELPAFRRRFGAYSRLGQMQIAPVLAYKAAGITGYAFLFDPRRPEGPTNNPPSVRNPQPVCPLPK